MPMAERNLAEVIQSERKPPSRRSQIMVRNNS